MEKELKFPAPPPPPPAPIPAPAPAEVETVGGEPLTLIREDLEEIAEDIIAKKWESIEVEVANLTSDLDAGLSEIEKFKDAIQKVEDRISNIEKAIFAKISEYSKGISDVNVELKAMQRVFKTMLPEFTTNIKDLRSLVEKAKKKK